MPGERASSGEKHEFLDQYLESIKVHFCPADGQVFMFGIDRWLITIPCWGRVSDAPPGGWLTTRQALQFLTPFH
jgi:hypothetical protein